MNHWIYDEETLANCFVIVLEDYRTDERHIFVIHDLRNDLPALIEFLINAISKEQRFIGFNCLNFDSQILQFILNQHKRWSNLSGCEIAKIIYAQAQKTIEKSDRGEFAEFPEWKQSTKQIDLFKMNHWDNPAKSSSLKWIQFSMDWHNVQEMPIHHSTVITTMQQIEEIIDYCCNDVGSTKEVYQRSKEQLKLRQALTNEYGINLYSASEPRISKELFGYFLSKRLNIEKSDLKQMRTRRDKIVLNDIILPYFNFTTPEFKSILEFFKSKTINAANLKGSLNYSITHKGVKTDYGLGGVHGCRQKGIYEAKNGMIIMSSDVTSFYPNLAIRNKWSPLHLPKEEFCELYEWFFEERKKIPKKDPKNYVYKIILNSTYGLSNDENSFLYDPEFTMRITINGQLSLSLLYEMLSTRIPNSVPVMQNTDGLEMMIPEEYYDLYMEICKEWEELTSLQLEHDQYKKMILFDVNNYIGIFKNGKTKCKGRFEYQDLALHKNKSFLIVPKAIYSYFVDGTKPEDYLNKNQNIFDYCGGVKAKGSWIIQEHSIKNGEYKIKDLQKMVRYFISKSAVIDDKPIELKQLADMRIELLDKGWLECYGYWNPPDFEGDPYQTGLPLEQAWLCIQKPKYVEGDVKLVKKNPDGREIQVESGRWMQTTFNKYVDLPFENYNINLDYYLEKIYKEINSVDNTVSRQYTQLALF